MVVGGAPLGSLKTSWSLPLGPISSSSFTLMPLALSLSLFSFFFTSAFKAFFMAPFTSFMSLSNNCLFFSSVAVSTSRSSYFSCGSRPVATSCYFSTAASYDFLYSFMTLMTSGLHMRLLLISWQRLKTFLCCLMAAPLKALTLFIKSCVGCAAVMLSGRCC